MAFAQLQTRAAQPDNRVLAPLWPFQTPTSALIMTIDVLNCARLPARLSAEQAGALLGFAAHEIPLLIKAKMLVPLGNPAPNAHKFFSTDELLELSQNRQWLAKATKKVSEHWRDRNQKGPLAEKPEALGVRSAS